MVFSFVRAVSNVCLFLIIGALYLFVIIQCTLEHAQDRVDGTMCVVKVQDDTVCVVQDKGWHRVCSKGSGWYSVCST